MGRRRGQRPTKRNPFRRGDFWYVKFREDSRELDGSLRRVDRTRKLAPAKGDGALTQKQAQRLAYQGRPPGSAGEAAGV